jgi:hypothetical protein
MNAEIMGTEAELRMRILKALGILVFLPVDSNWDSKLSYRDYRKLVSILRGD